MAARTVTSFTQYINQAQIAPRKTILVTGPNQAVDDQQFALEVEQVMLTDCFAAITFTGAGYVTLGTWYFHARDMCGVVSSENCEFYVLAQASSASNFTISLNVNAGGQNPIAVTADTTSKIWRGPTTISIPTTTDNFLDAVVEGKRDSGVGTISLFGLAIYSGS